MDGKYILALDQGTTSSRAMVFDREGSVVSSAQREFRQIYPIPGWVEHDPSDIWASQSAVAAEAVTKANLGVDDLEAAGIANQRETVVLWRRSTGAPVCNAVVWQDRRTSEMCRRLRDEGLEPLFRERTGLRLDPYFSGTKLSWLLEHVEGARALAERGDLLFGTVDSWLVWKFTGGARHVTDVTNAARTLMFNLREERWDPDLLEILNVPESVLPEVVSSSGEVGRVAQDQFPAGVPIMALAGDQHAALFGQACFERGMAKNTCGTGTFLLMQTGTTPVWSNNQLLTTPAWKLEGVTEYALEGSVFAGGAVVQWLRDELEMIRSAEECDRLAAEVEDSNGLVLVPAFTGLGAPHWDPEARGVCVGLTRGVNRRHFCRAALESVAFQTADLIECMEKDAGIPLRELRVDGGVSRSGVMMHFQADLLGVDTVRPACVETTAWGAASLAGLATGFWSDRDEVARCWREGARFRPSADPEAMREARRMWTRAVSRSKHWVES